MIFTKIKALSYFCSWILFVVIFCSHVSAQVLTDKTYSFTNALGFSVGGDFTKVIRGDDGNYYFLGKSRVGTSYDEDPNFPVPYLVDVDTDAVYLKTDSNLNFISCINSGVLSGACCGNGNWNDIPAGLIAQNGQYLFLTSCPDFYASNIKTPQYDNVSEWDLLSEGMFLDVLNGKLIVYGYYNGQGTTPAYGLIYELPTSSFFSTWAKQIMTSPCVIIDGYLSDTTYCFALQMDSTYSFLQTTSNYSPVNDVSYNMNGICRVVSMIPVGNERLFLGTYNNSDYFLHKTDSLGNTVWFKVYDSGLIENATSVAYNNGRIYITGNTPSSGQLLIADTSGNILSAKSYSGMLINAVCQEAYTTSTIVMAGQNNNHPIALRSDINGNAGGCNESPLTFSINNSITVNDLFNTISYSGVNIQGGCIGCGGGEISAVNNSTICSQNLGIGNEIFENSIKIYPNPANDIFTIEFTETNRIEFIEISDAYGKQLAIKENPDRRETFNLSDFNSSVIFIAIHCNDGIVVKKLVKF